MPFHVHGRKNKFPHEPTDAYVGRQFSSPHGMALPRSDRQSGAVQRKPLPYTMASVAAKTSRIIRIYFKTLRKNRSYAVSNAFSPDTEYLKWFVELSRIPHESRNEKKLSDFLVSFARERGLDVTQDELGSVLIKKPGTKGMENAPAVILQGHMDMVCVKDEGVDFDFASDALRLVSDGDRLYAEGTTLGADNGIALAYILAVLDSSDIPHPPLEVVVTVQEEVGMGGAHAFDASLLTASSFINMDSEDEGVFCVSCAGGRRSQMHIPAVTADVATLEDHDAYSFRTITVGGLAGGHSGLEIIKERGNSNRLLARVLDDIRQKFPCRLVSLNGGTATNAIPKESSAVVLIKAADEDIRRELDAWTAVFRHELRGADGAGLTIALEEAPVSSVMLSSQTEANVLAASLLMPDGIVSMDMNITTQRLVESSNNFAMIRMEEGEIVLHCQTRSSVSSKKDAICRQIAVLGSMVGGRVEYFGDYPAWEYNPDSRLQTVFCRAYEELFHKTAKVEGIHAGLECGLFAEKFKKLGHDMDFIAFGPNVTGAHSTKETLSLSSAENTWKLLLDVLRRMGESA